MTTAEARQWMRDEFGPDSEAKNEDRTPMTEAQLDDAANAWIEYFNDLNSYFARRNG